MTTHADGVRTRGHVLLPAAILVLCAAASSGGCAGTTYQAAKLPPEFLAPVTEKVDAIDISRLSTYAVRSDRIDRGDVLEVTILTDYGNMRPMPVPVRVGEDGQAKIQYIGSVPLAGLTLDEAERAIEAAGVQRNKFRDPHVTVTMQQQRMNRITVTGAVEEQGVIEVPRGNCNLLSVLVEAGGLSEEAGTNVEIRRPAKRLYPPDPFQTDAPHLAEDHPGQLTAYEYEEGSPRQARTVRVNLASAAGQGRGGYYLDDGDVVNVEKRPPRKVYVSGLVRSPGEYELPRDEDLHVLNALSMAGGSRLQGADTILIIRRVEGRQEPVRIKTSIHEARINGQANVRLAANDQIVLEETPLTMAFETLKTFFRFSVGSSLALF